MKRKYIALLFVLIFSLTMFSSCKKEPVSLYYDIDTAPINLDPQSANDYSSKLIINNLYEGLFKIGENGELENGVCKSYTVSDDGLKFRFILRDDSKWMDGTVVTAYDFEFAFKRLFDASTNSQSADDFFCILNSRPVYEGEIYSSELGVKAVSNFVLEIELSEYNSRFLYMLTTTAAMPCNEEFFISTKGKYGLSAKMICGNGPFYLSSWKEDSLIVIKNANYYEDSLTKSVTFNILTENDDKTKRFLEGKTSAVSADGDVIKELSEKKYQILNNENTVWGIVFNTGSSIFSNSNIRKALISDSNYTSMQSVLPDYYKKASSIIPDNIRIGENSYREFVGENLITPYNPQLAKEFYKKGLNELELDYITKAVMIIPKGMGHEDYSAYISQIWQKDLGIYLTVEVLEQEEYNARLENGNFDCAVISLNGDYNSPYALLSKFSSGYSKNISGFSDEEFDTLLSEAIKEPKEEKAAESYKKAEQIILSNGVFLPLYYQSEYFVVDKDYLGIHYDFDTRIVNFQIKE